jgi:predicted Zn finger-like uncharacterized protein
MQGTTVCPNCDARFKITKEQLTAHHGMVRCGNCKQAFDVRPNFVPDQLDLQLELPILDEPAPAADSRIAVLQPMTLAEQVAFVQDDGAGGSQPKRRIWPWTMASLSLLLLICAQAAYYFRVDLAANLPKLRPALNSYCRLLKCTLPLPQHSSLISIESSQLQADPGHASQIIFDALLRNRASYAQAYPDLELTLNDSSDQALARRIFSPADYLPSPPGEAAGFPANSEFGIKLRMDTADIKPSGYRLVVLYSNKK